MTAPALDPITIRPHPEPQTIPGSAVPVLYAPGALDHLGRFAAGLGRRCLLVSDPGLLKAGHVARAEAILRAAGLEVITFTDTGENPTTDHVEQGLAVARPAQVDLLVGLGGGSAMDTAKGVNFLLTNGGRVQDYWGVGKAAEPMLPLIAVPTTTGTGSEAQSAALITDPATHQKMACLDKKALARLAILDPDLTATQPPAVAALTGLDAISHAVETAGTTKRTDASRRLSAAAWSLLAPHFERSLTGDPAARAAMQLGAHLAGCAIETSMLGAAHACANPLTAAVGLAHGAAVGVMLPHVIRFNAAPPHSNPYADLADALALAARVDAFLTAASLPRTLREVGLTGAHLRSLAAQAARQWTATFNPRPVAEADLLSLYEKAL